MQKRNLCLFHKSSLNRITDDNKGVKFYHLKPYCNSNSKWLHSPCCRQFERSNYFTSILFYHLQVNENFLKLVTEFLKKFYYLPVYFFTFHNKEALLFRAKPLPVGSKIVTSSTSLSMSPQF